MRSWKHRTILRSRREVVRKHKHSLEKMAPAKRSQHSPGISYSLRDSSDSTIMVVFKLLPLLPRQMKPSIPQRLTSTARKTKSQKKRRSCERFWFTHKVTSMCSIKSTAGKIMENTVLRTQAHKGMCLT